MNGNTENYKVMGQTPEQMIMMGSYPTDSDVLLIPLSALAHGFSVGVHPQGKFIDDNISFNASDKETAEKLAGCLSALFENYKKHLDQPK